MRQPRHTRMHSPTLGAGQQLWAWAAFRSAFPFTVEKSPLWPREYFHRQPGNAATPQRRQIESGDGSMPTIHVLRLLFVLTQRKSIHYLKVNCWTRVEHHSPKILRFQTRLLAARRAAVQEEPTSCSPGIWVSIKGLYCLKPSLTSPSLLWPVRFLGGSSGNTNSCINQMGIQHRCSQSDVPFTCIFVREKKSTHSVFLKRFCYISATATKWWCRVFNQVVPLDWHDENPENFEIGSARAADKVSQLFRRFENTWCECWCSIWQLLQWNGKNSVPDESQKLEDWCKFHI